MVPATEMFTCPHCDAGLTERPSACPDCGIRLTGPEAARLWQIDQQIAGLQTLREGLVARLLQPAAEVPAYPRALVSTDTAAAAGRAPAAKAVTGQQVLLALGALLVLSAAVFFVVVVWLVVGLIGQAAIMATGTATAVVGAAWATRRRLPAAAETGAVLATGLLIIDAAAAHGLNLAGLGRIEPAWYWAGATLLLAVLLLAADAAMPRTRAGERLRAVLTFRPAAAALAAVAPWCVLAATGWAGAALVGGFGGVALLTGAAAAVAGRWDTVAVRAGRPASLVPLAASATLGAVAYLAWGLQVAYDFDRAGSERYTAAGLLTLVPVAVGVLSATWLRAGVSAQNRALLPYVLLGTGAAAAGVPLLDAPVWTLLGLAAVSAAAQTVAYLRTAPPAATEASLPEAASFAVAWRRALLHAGAIAQPVLFLLVAAGLRTEESRAAAYFAGRGMTSTVSAVEVTVMVVPAVLWALVAAVATARTRAAGWLIVAQVAVAASMFTGLQAAPARAWMVAMCGLFAVMTAGACLGVQHVDRHRAPGQPVGLRGGGLGAVVDLTCRAFGAFYALVAVGAGVESRGGLAAPLVFLGLATLFYAAASPRRFGFVYVASLSISAGSAVFLAERDVTVVEAYSMPLAVLLAGVGYVHWRRNRTAPTMVTMGPVLAVVFGPSLLAALGAGETARLLGVTLAAIVVLLGGLAQRWKSPVTAGALVLIMVAVTQGGPLVGYVPGWVTLGIAGALLLTAGILWEKAVVAGRRANTWYTALT